MQAISPPATNMKLSVAVGGDMDADGLQTMVTAAPSSPPSYPTYVKCTWPRTSISTQWYFAYVSATVLTFPSPKSVARSNKKQIDWAQLDKEVGQEVDKEEEESLSGDETQVLGVSTAGVQGAQQTLFDTGAGWVGVTTYLDTHGNVRVKKEVLCAMSGITTGNAPTYPNIETAN